MCVCVWGGGGGGGAHRWSKLVLDVHSLLHLTDSISMACLRACAASSCVTSIRLTPSHTRIWSPTFSQPAASANEIYGLSSETTIEF